MPCNEHMTGNQGKERAAPQPGRYEIDTSQSTITFTSRHLFGLLPVHGTFAIRGGTIEVSQPRAASTVQAEVDAASFHTGSERRDTDVRSARFLDTARHPVLTFDSERVDDAGVAGRLTARGVTRQVVLTIERLDVASDSVTAYATVRIDRTDFGVTAARGLAGRYLDLALEVRAVRAPRARGTAHD